MRKRILSFALLLAILLPMIAITAYGATSNFSFAFNGNTAAWRAYGTKSGLGLTPAQANVTTGDFGIGQVEFKMTDLDGLPVTVPIYVNTFGNYSMNYGRALPNKTGYFVGTPTSAHVWACGGTFTP